MGGSTNEGYLLGVSILKKDYIHDLECISGSPYCGKLPYVCRYVDIHIYG